MKGGDQTVRLGRPGQVKGDRREKRETGSTSARMLEDSKKKTLSNG